MIKLRPLDIVVLEGKYTNPINLAIMIAATIRAGKGIKDTHCVVVRDRFGNIYDADVGGIQARTMDFYKGRKCKIMRHKMISKIDTTVCLDWLAEKYKTCHGYDYLAWLGFATGIKAFEDEFHWYCSELGYWLFQYYPVPKVHLTIEEQKFFYPHEFVCDKMAMVYQGKI